MDGKGSGDVRPGLVEVHLYRPFSAAHLLSVLPESVRQITVPPDKRTGRSGRASLSGCGRRFKEFQVPQRSRFFRQIRAEFQRYRSQPDLCRFPQQAPAGKQVFTLGITDDVTHLSLDIREFINAGSSSAICCKFWGLGGDGTVSANKNSVKIIGNHTDKYVQAYFDYDSKKSRGLTVSHLRFSDSPIRSLIWFARRILWRAIILPIFINIIWCRR